MPKGKGPKNGALTLKHGAHKPAGNQLGKRRCAISYAMASVYLR
jgi:hypothetical protein